MGRWTGECVYTRPSSPGGIAGSGVARASRVLVMRSRHRGLFERLFRRHAETNTRDACATRSSDRASRNLPYRATSATNSQTPQREAATLLPTISAANFQRELRDR